MGCVTAESSFDKTNIQRVRVFWCVAVDYQQRHCILGDWSCSGRGLIFHCHVSGTAFNIDEALRKERCVHFNLGPKLVLISNGMWILSG